MIEERYSILPDFNEVPNYVGFLLNKLNSNIEYFDPEKHIYLSNLIYQTKNGNRIKGNAPCFIDIETIKKAYRFASKIISPTDNTKELSRTKILIDDINSNKIDNNTLIDFYMKEDIRIIVEYNLKDENKIITRGEKELYPIKSLLIYDSKIKNNQLQLIWWCGINVGILIWILLNQAKNFGVNSFYSYIVGGKHNLNEIQSSKKFGFKNDSDPNSSLITLNLENFDTSKENFNKIIGKNALEVNKLLIAVEKAEKQYNDKDSIKDITESIIYELVDKLSPEKIAKLSKDESIINEILHLIKIDFNDETIISESTIEDEFIETFNTVAKEYGLSRPSIKFIKELYRILPEKEILDIIKNPTVIIKIIQELIKEIPDRDYEPGLTFEQKKEKFRQLFINLINNEPKFQTLKPPSDEDLLILAQTFTDEEIDEFDQDINDPIDGINKNYLREMLEASNKGEDILRPGKPKPVSFFKKDTEEFKKQFLDKLPNVENPKIINIEPEVNQRKFSGKDATKVKASLRKHKIPFVDKEEIKKKPNKNKSLEKSKSPQKNKSPEKKKSNGSIIKLSELESIAVNVELFNPEIHQLMQENKKYSLYSYDNKLINDYIPTNKYNQKFLENLGKEYKILVARIKGQKYKLQIDEFTTKHGIIGFIVFNDKEDIRFIYPWFGSKLDLLLYVALEFNKKKIIENQIAIENDDLNLKEKRSVLKNMDFKKKKIENDNFEIYNGNDNLITFVLENNLLKNNIYSQLFNDIIIPKRAPIKPKKVAVKNANEWIQFVTNLNEKMNLKNFPQRKNGNNVVLVPICKSKNVEFVKDKKGNIIKYLCAENNEKINNEEIEY